MVRSRVGADLNTSLEGKVQTPSMYQVILQVFISTKINTQEEEEEGKII